MFFHSTRSRYIASKRMQAYPRGTEKTATYGMPKIALTDRFCSTSKPLSGARTDFFDETVSGLALRVADTGHKTWSYHFTSPRDGKRARLTIGVYPATSLAGARGRAIEARGQVDLGQDPRLAGRSGVAEMTVAALVEAFLADPEEALAGARRGDPPHSPNVIPVIGTVKIADLRRRDVRTATARTRAPWEARRGFPGAR